MKDAIDKLTPLQFRFVELLLGDPDINPVDAYLLAAGKSSMKKGVAAAAASRLLKHNKIQAALRDVQLQRSAEKKQALAITVENVLNKYADMTFGQVTDMVNIETVTEMDWELGQEVERQRVVIKDTKGLPRHIKSMIKSISEKVNARGDRTIVVEFHDQLRAQEALARYLGIWRDNILSAQVILQPQVIEQDVPKPVDMA